MVSAGLPAELEFPLRLEGLPEGLLQYLALIEARPAVAQVGRGDWGVELWREIPHNPP